MQNHKEITNNLLPISGRVAGNGLTFGWRSNSEDDFPSDERETMKSPGKKSVRNRKATTKPQNPRPSSSQRAAPSTSAPSHNRAESPATAKAEHVDLTRSDDDTYSDSLKRSDRSSDLIQAAARNIETDLSAQRDLIRINKFAGAGEAPEKDSKNSTHENSSSQETNTAAAPTTIDPVLDVAPLPEDHDTTFLNEARLEFISKRPPFVRRNIKEDPRWMVTLAIGDGELPQIAVLTKLVTRQWDSSFSYYTLDLNGERLIVKPFGGKSKHKNRAGNPYRTWSGQGNVFERAPVAFSFLGDTEEQTSNRKVVGDDLDSDFGGISIQGSDSLGDEDYSSTTSEGSDSLLKPRATRARLAHLNTNRDNGDTNGDTRSSRALSEVAAGKRPAGDAIEDDHTPKRVRQTDTNNSVNPSTTARIPPTLTSYKQEHTILYVVLPGSTSDMVPIKLRSVMTISTFFNSVSAAAGVTDYEHMAVAVLLGGEDGGHILVRQNLLDSFECFLEIVDDAPCWEEEGGRMALQLQLRWRHTFELNIRV